MLFPQVGVVIAVTYVQNKPFVKIKDDMALVMRESWFYNLYKVHANNIKPVSSQLKCEIKILTTSKV